MNLLKLAFFTLTLFTFICAAPFVQADKNFSWMKTEISSLKEIPVTVKPSSGKLILSDSPEMVKRDGIMYQDTVEGDVRLFFHHVNDTSEPKKIIVLLINEETEETKIELTHFGVGGPGLDYMAVGKYAQNNYFHPKYKRTFTIFPKKNTLLDISLNFLEVPPNALVNGIYDFHASKPVKVAVLMAPLDAEPIDAYNNSIILPADKERLRGTFSHMDRIVTLDKPYSSTETGLGIITLADDKVDKFSYGIDATDGSQTKNYGNYGVMYRIYLPSRLDSNFSVFLNPRGGVYAGAIDVGYRHAQRQTIETPSGKVFFGETSNDFSHLGNYTGANSLWLTFSSPGASNLPVKIIIAPHHYEQ